jgi:hypothetical protein
MKKIVILCICAFAHLYGISSGFVAGALVKTLDGFIAIEQLNEHDIISVLGEDGVYTRKAVVIKSTCYVDHIVKLCIEDDEILLAGLKQEFLKFGDTKWTFAEDLVVGDQLLTSRGYVTIRGIKICACETDLHWLSVLEVANFYVSKYEIVVRDTNIFRHNVRDIS